MDQTGNEMEEEKNANKSETSTIFQIALKHNMPASFEVKVGHEITTGTGPKKKIAKRNASKAMLLQIGYKASSLLQEQSETLGEIKGWNCQNVRCPEPKSGEQPAGTNEVRRNKEEKAWGKQIFMS